MLFSKTFRRPLCAAPVQRNTFQPSYDRNTSEHSNFLLPQVGTLLKSVILNLWLCHSRPVVRAASRCYWSRHRCSNFCSAVSKKKFRAIDQIGFCSLFSEGRSRRGCAKWLKGRAAFSTFLLGSSQFKIVIFIRASEAGWGGGRWEQKGFEAAPFKDKSRDLVDPYSLWKWYVCPLTMRCLMANQVELKKKSTRKKPTPSKFTLLLI